MHVSKKTQKEDMKSTAYSFTLVSIIGIPLLILFAAGILPIAVPDYKRVLITLVMGAVLAVFLFIGIRSFMDLKKLGSEAEVEEKSISEITNWFCLAYTSEDIDKNLDTEQEAETLYFGRYEVMSGLILAQYPDLSEDFLDHMIETLYARLF